MAKRIISAKQGKNTDMNGEGNEKVDGTSSTVADLKTYTVNDTTDAANTKIRGMAAGYREATRTN